MAIPPHTHQALANHFATLGTWITVFTAAGGTTGANEAILPQGRKQTVFPTATLAIPSVAQGSTVNIPVNSGTYTEGGIFSAASGGTFRGSEPFSDGVVMVSGSGASIDVTPVLKA